MESIGLDGLRNGLVNADFAGTLCCASIVIERLDDDLAMGQYFGSAAILIDQQRYQGFFGFNDGADAGFNLFFQSSGKLAEKNYSGRDKDGQEQTTANDDLLTQEVSHQDKGVR